jgi:hypothetical protein
LKNLLYGRCHLLKRFIKALEKYALSSIKRFRCFAPFKNYPDWWALSDGRSLIPPEMSCNRSLSIQKF